MLTIRRGSSSRAIEAGFSLLEMLVALALFAMISSMVYLSLSTTADGFSLLEGERRHQRDMARIKAVLKQDAAYLAVSLDSSLQPVVLHKDRRSDLSYDRLALTVREMDRPLLSLVRYRVDEASGELIRESAVPWVRSRGGESIIQRLGKIESFDVELLNQSGQSMAVHSRLSQIPASVKVTVQDRVGEMGWIFPVSVDALPGNGRPL